MSVELKTIAALFGVQEAYATSRTTLARRIPVELSPNRIRAACQSAGEMVLAAEAAILTASQDLHQQTRLYLSVDGFQAPFEDGWHELKAGVLWEAGDHKKAHHQHYFVDTVTIDEFAKLVWAKAWQQGAHLAKQLVILGDGSIWIWNMAKRLFPNAMHSVASFHAASYLGKLSADAFGEGSTEAIAWFEHHKALSTTLTWPLSCALAVLSAPSHPLLRTPPAVTLPITGPACAIPYAARSAYKLGRGSWTAPVNKSAYNVSTCRVLVGAKMALVNLPKPVLPSYATRLTSRPSLCHKLTDNLCSHPQNRTPCVRIYAALHSDTIC